MGNSGDNLSSTDLSLESARTLYRQRGADTLYAIVRQLPGMAAVDLSDGDTSPGMDECEKSVAPTVAADCAEYIGLFCVVGLEVANLFISGDVILADIDTYTRIQNMV